MTATLAALVFMAGMASTALGIGFAIQYGKTQGNSHAMASAMLPLLGCTLVFVSGVILP